MPSLDIFCLIILVGATSQILETEVPGYMIVFTDGMSGNTSTAIENEFDIDPLYLTGDFHVHIFLSKILYFDNND